MITGQVQKLEKQAKLKPEAYMNLEQYAFNPWADNKSGKERLKNA